MDDFADVSAPAGRTVLVTGGAGFVGRHLVDALTPENDVRVLDSLDTGDSAVLPDDVELIRGDVRDREAVRDAMDGVDLVYHLAAVVSVTESMADPERSHAVNVSGTMTVLERAREADARVVLASSASVYGDPEEVPVRESAPKRPRSPYATDKLAADHYARMYAEAYELPTVVLRYFNIYGPGQRGPYSGVVEAFFEQAGADEPLTIEGDGEQTRDFVHVDDVVRANLAAATTPHTGTAFNVGTGDSVTINELAEIVRTVTGADSQIRYEAPRPGDVRHSRADTQRANTKLGFEARRTLRGGLRQLVSTRAIEND